MDNKCIQDSNVELDSIVVCSKIEARVEAWYVTRWGLNSIEGGQALYVSGTYSMGRELHLTLSDLDLPIGTLCYLEALVVAGRDVTADIIIQYDPLSNKTAKFLALGTTTRPQLQYRGTY